MKISSKKWLILYLAIQLAMLTVVAGIVVYIDPFFHYHKPLDTIFYYSLDNERSQNNGITRNFDYDMLITGTSMTENFKTSEADRIFDAHSVKVSYSGGSYKEINDNIEVAIKNNRNLKIVIRCLDMGMFYSDKDLMRDDLGVYPVYLNNDNPFDDVKYIYNRNVIFDRCDPMVRNARLGKPGGITSFDEYSCWMPEWIGKFGKDIILEKQTLFIQPVEENHLSDEEKNIIKANIEQNVTQTALENQNVQFYYFFPPYSAVWWGNIYQLGNLPKQIETEKYIIEMILKCNNIHLFSFNNFTEITTNLENYKDDTHYGGWINSDMLQYMHEGVGELTNDNYERYLREEYDFYSTFNYNEMF